ncbi:unnamed protein product, partial [Prorocentrum cordatum]
GGQTGPAPKVTLAKGHSCVYNADAAARNPRKKPNLEDPREKCDWGEARGTLNAAASSTAAGSHRAARGAKNPRAPRRRAPGSLMGVSTAVEGGGPGRLCVAPGVGSATVEQKGISWPLRAARPLRAAVALVALSQPAAGGRLRQRPLARKRRREEEEEEEEEEGRPLRAARRLRAAVARRPLAAAAGGRLRQRPPPRGWRRAPSQPCTLGLLRRSRRRCRRRRPSLGLPRPRAATAARGECTRPYKRGFTRCLAGRRRARVSATPAAASGRPRPLQESPAPGGELAAL